MTKREEYLRITSLNRRIFQNTWIFYDLHKLNQRINNMYYSLHICGSFAIGVQAKTGEVMTPPLTNGWSWTLRSPTMSDTATSPPGLRPSTHCLLGPTSRLLPGHWLQTSHHLSLNPTVNLRKKFDNRSHRSNRSFNSGSRVLFCSIKLLIFNIWVDTQILNLRKTFR